MFRWCDALRWSTSPWTGFVAPSADLGRVFLAFMWLVEI